MGEEPEADVVEDTAVAAEDTAVAVVVADTEATEEEVTMEVDTVEVDTVAEDMEVMPVEATVVMEDMAVGATVEEATVPEVMAVEAMVAMEDMEAKLAMGLKADMPLKADIVEEDTVVVEATIKEDMVAVEDTIKEDMEAKVVMEEAKEVMEEGGKVVVTAVDPATVDREMQPDEVETGNSKGRADTGHINYSFSQNELNIFFFCINCLYSNQRTTTIINYSLKLLFLSKFKKKKCIRKINGNLSNGAKIHKRCYSGSS
mmetsp:Transcript_9732/g.12644  ORF Transcript_9732/g.12644 Transcript_9732/m.12644 type:complete len:259 (+) Transcript_9732:1688-2464(+)